MRIGEIKPGTWFKHKKGRFIKTIPILRFSVYYQAVNLDTGIPAFKTSTAGSRDSSRKFENVEVQPIEKS